MTGNPAAGRGRFLAGAALGFLVGVLVCGAAGWWAFRQGLEVLRSFDAPWKGWSGEEIFVEIPPGANARAVARLLAEAKAIPDEERFLWLLRLTGDEGRLQAGEYRFAAPQSPRQVARRIVEGDIHRVRVTIPEGLSLPELRGLLVAAGHWSGEDLDAAFRRTDLVADLDPLATDLEGYLFPETYSFPRRSGASEFVGLQVAQFRRALGPEGAEKARALGLDVRGLVTLASLVEEEAKVPGERPVIASVFLNRLREGMRLECDPTVLYAIRRDGRAIETLAREDLQYDSPWNTYRAAGLPPGPISSPGLSALRAALEPAATDYLYFVVSEEGGSTHSFSRSYRDHLRAVDAFRRSRGR